MRALAYFRGGTRGAVGRDMLAAHVDAIVNPVTCDDGGFVPGTMFVVDRAPQSPRWVINFPVKRHWRDPSRLDDIRAGMADLVAQIRARGIHSVAVPVLREGLGGLAWAELRPLILEACGAVPEVRVLLFSPPPA